MKRILALLLCAVMLFPFGGLFVSAAPKTETAFAGGENELIVFVTGIGQSWSYLFDENSASSGALQSYDNYADLIARGQYSASWSLFNDMSSLVKETETLKAMAKVVSRLLLSVFTRRNMVEQSDADALVRQLFKYNMLDENGQSSPLVVVPRYAIPVSEYPGYFNRKGEFVSEAKDRFYGSIPCEEVARDALGENYEDYLYCFNYSPFSYTSQNVEDLHSFIETILAENKVGAKKVVLVPMSMGASVVSSYLYAYPEVAQNHVHRVVSIVGCWQGSTIVYDLVTQKYADNSAELFYNGIVADLVGEPWGYLVNILLRLFPKAGLRGLIDIALKSISRNLIFTSPSLMALMPPDVYPEVRPQITSARVRKETDRYYDAQITLKDRMEALKKQGVTFSFISGYGLPYGGASDDYKFFGFLYHAARTNSDEIINIDSTAPGTAFVAFDKQFADKKGRVLSPDGSIDISSTWNKDSSWFFYRQKHELEYNNTAIRLGIRLATGRIQTVNDCADPAGKLYFPQFNGARNVSALTRDYIPDLEDYLAKGNTLTPAQQKLYDDVLAMLNCTVNDPEKDNALIDRFYQMLTELGVYRAQKENTLTDRLNNGLTAVLKDTNDKVNAVFGAKGFLDQPLSLPRSIGLSFQN